MLVPEGSQTAPSTVTIPLTLVQDDIGDRGAEETRRVFTSASGYEAYFAHPAPAGVDWSREWLALYSAGTRRSGGYQASIESAHAAPSSRTLIVTTKLVSPGAGCIVTMGLTKPYALVKFPMPSPPLDSVQFWRVEEARDCDQAEDACSKLICAPGTHCEMVEVQCVRAPCPPQPACVPDRSFGPMCGGIAGFRCPGAGTCVDDPRDSCDPAKGGADCGGLCRCDVMGLCLEGSRWDSSPEVCGCVPDDQGLCAAVQCPTGTSCVADPKEKGRALCISDGTLRCGKATCPAGQVCCNPSCSICTPPDGACIQMACE